MSWGQFKPLLTDALVAHLEPIQVNKELVIYLLCLYLDLSILSYIGSFLSDRYYTFFLDQTNLIMYVFMYMRVLFVQKRYAEIIADPLYIDSILADGGAKANEIAQVTLSNAFQAMGFLSRRPIA